MQVPETSTTLLLDLTEPQHARWADFCVRYEPMMRAFMSARFPFLEADDVIQETLSALVKALPNYRYDPEESGYFHNYLTGVLRNKALKILVERRHDERIKASVVAANESNRDEVDRDREYREWRDAVYEIALRQLLADGSIQERTKQFFIKQAVDGLSSQQVADELSGFEDGEEIAAKTDDVPAWLLAFGAWDETVAQWKSANVFASFFIRPMFVCNDKQVAYSTEIQRDVYFPLADEDLAEVKQVKVCYVGGKSAK